MAVSETPRLGLTLWTEDTDPFTRSQMEQSHQNLELRAARIIIGTATPSPAAEYFKAFFYNTSTSRLYFYSAEDEFGTWAEVVGNFVSLETFNAKGDIVAGTADNTVGVLTVGTNNQRLIADSSQSTGLRWVSDTQNTVIDSKGDLLAGTADNTVGRLAAGANGTVLIADSGETTGLRWGSTISNATLSSPTIDTAVVNNAVFKSPEERWTVSATAATGTVNIDCLNSGAVYYTSDATANWTLNFRGNSGTALTSVLETNDSISVVFAAKQGSTAYIANTFRVDTTITPTVFWQGGTIPSAGNANSVDFYACTLLRTGASTFSLFISQTKFAIV
jgi:hypothetical protein